MNRHILADFSLQNKSRLNCRKNLLYIVYSNSVDAGNINNSTCPTKEHRRKIYGQFTELFMCPHRGHEVVSILNVQYTVCSYCSAELINDNTF
jgi:hypothetical protein